MQKRVKCCCTVHTKLLVFNCMHVVDGYLNCWAIHRSIIACDHRDFSVPSYLQCVVAIVNVAASKYFVITARPTRRNDLEFSSTETLSSKQKSYISIVARIPK